MFKTKLFLLLSFFIYLSVIGEDYNGPTNLFLRFYDNLAINGPSNLHLVKAKSLEINGPLEFHSLDVSGKAEIKGPVKGDKGKFGQLAVMGTLDVDHVITEELSVKGAVKATYLDVTNKAEIDGVLDTKHSKFKTLVVNADKTVLDEVIVDSIFVKKGPKNQILILKGPTVVNGDIEFESGDGIVQMESPEVQLKGILKGATLKK